MANLLFIVLCIDIVIYAASQFRYSGYGWADYVCLNTFGLCDQPRWLEIAAMAFFLGAYFAIRRR